MVASEIVLPVDRETARELLTDPLRREWLREEWEEREAVVEHEEPGGYLSWWWDDGARLARRGHPHPAVGGTRISVTEQPVTAPMALARG